MVPRTTNKFGLIKSIKISVHNEDLLGKALTNAEVTFFATILTISYFVSLHTPRLFFSEIFEIWYILFNINKTSQELRMLCRSLTDCESLLLNVMIQVSQFVSNSQLCHKVTDSLTRSQSKSKSKLLSL